MSEAYIVSCEIENPESSGGQLCKAGTISHEELRDFTDSQQGNSKRQRVRPRKRGTRSHLTRELIVARARQLLEEEGFDALSLRGLATRLGVTAPALYGHVEGKRDLFERLGEDGYARLAQALRPLHDENPIVQIHHFAQTYLDFARDNYEQFRMMMLVSPEALGGNCCDGLASASDAFGQAAATVSRAAELGLLEGHDLEQTNFVIWGTVYGVTSVVLESRGALSRDQENDLLHQTLATILRGLDPGWQTEPQRARSSPTESSPTAQSYCSGGDQR